MTFPYHVLLVPTPLRSHTRSLAQLGFNILRIHPDVCLTFFATPADRPMIEEDISLQGAGWKREMEGRYRIETRGDAIQGDTNAKIGQVMQLFPSYWAELAGNTNGGKNGFEKKPCLVLIGAGVRASIEKAEAEDRGNGGVHTRMLSFAPSSTLASNPLAASWEDGGRLDGMSERYQQYQKEGLSKDEAGFKAYRGVENRLLHFANLPPMYDYELTPQALARSIGEGTIQMMKMLYNTWHAARDGVYLAVPELEGEAIAELSKLLKGKIFGVGPQLNESAWIKNEEEHSEENDAHGQVFEFLDAAHKKYGANTAAYISFGTLFWPDRRPEIIEWIVESLLTHDPPVPFVFATASQSGKMDPALLKRVEDSGRGIVVDWCPQVRVLQHPATGMFLTHAGFGSITEAISAGVPVLTMPFALDQPPLAAFFHQCGYDLKELKTGLAGLPLGDGYVVKGTKEAALAELHESWSKLRGENGDKIRGNVKKIRDIWHKSWTEGESRKAVERLREFFN